MKKGYLIAGRNVAGFTMLELAMVLIIIGVISAMGISATIGLLDSSKRKATEAKMDVIEDALIAFRKKYNRLPCPTNISLAFSNDATGTNFGKEGAALGNCTNSSPAATHEGTDIARGGVPVDSLELSREYMFDGWGRKFVYSVDTNLTYYKAFESTSPKEYCEITVQDAGSNPVTGNSTYTYGAAYVLMSHGSNGHGGYTINGVSKISAGSTDLSELQNCRCGNDASDAVATEGLYIQKDQTATFDDIVRYKELWQLQIDEDITSKSVYVGPDLALSLDQNGAGNIKFFERQCGKWKDYSGSSPTDYTVTAPQLGMNFTKNNAYIFSFSNGNCYLYAITYNVIGPASVGSVVCPAYFSGGPVTNASLSSNGYLVITRTLAPYMRVWRLDGINYTSFPITSPATIFSPALSAMPSKVIISKNGNYIAVTSSAASYTYVYYRSGQQYIRMTSPAGGSAFPAPTTAMAFSEDENYIAMGVVGSTTVRFYSINKLLNTFTLREDTTGPTTTASAIRFSPDGQYLTIAGGAPVAGAQYSTNIKLYNTQTTPVTNVTPSSAFTDTGTAIPDVRFDPTSTFLMYVYTGGSSSQRIIVFRRSVSDTFTYKTTIVRSSNGQPYQLRFAQ